jgi:hypothetical protein
MIKILKGSRNNIDLVFDRAGLEQTISLIENSLKGFAQSINVNLDKKFFEKRTEGFFDSNLSIQTTEPNGFPTFNLSAGQCLIGMDKEKQDYLLFSLQKALTANCFFPGELFDCDSSVFKDECTVIGYLK